MLFDTILILKDLLFVVNLLYVVVIVFYERKDPRATWAWLLVVLVIPYVGFVVYLLLGFDAKKHVIFSHKSKQDGFIYEQAAALFPFLGEPLANEVTIFFNGNDKFDKLFEDIESASEYIHLLYYIFRDDDLSRSLIELLAKKAREGVLVRLMLDGMGIRKVNKDIFKPLSDAGGQVVVFLPPSITRINFRNHRKIGIIDGKIGYIGGMNVGEEYMGLSSRYGFWRDTHARICGPAVSDMSLRFLCDWNFYAKNKLPLDKRYFPENPMTDGAKVKIISSGPDTRFPHIQYGMAKMIASAQSSIYIQTPYFSPDDSIYELLRMAALSGIDVRVLIPANPDHPFVYWASLSYLGDMLSSGVRPYQYNKGFLHSKLMIVDGKAVSTGTANMDIRSFKLNFEINAFIFDASVAQQCEAQFMNDLTDSTEITYDSYKKRSRFTKIRESVSRLLSPLL